MIREKITKARIDNIEKDAAANKTKIGDIENRVNENEAKITDLKNKVNTVTGSDFNYEHEIKRFTRTH